MSAITGRAWAVVAAGILLALYWWMATSVSDGICTTSDEVAHLTAGYSYWTTNDYRLQPENGNLPQRAAALPVVLSNVRYPTLDQAAWRISDVWEMGFRWFYESGNDVASMLRDGRRVIALFGVAAGALVFAWGRRLFGDAGGVLAALLFAFCPTMLANGALVTSDMAATCLFLATVTAFWAMAHRLTPLRWALFALSLGLLCVAKFSAPLAAPMCAVLWAARVARGGDLEASWPLPPRLAGRLRAGAALAGASAAACLVAVAVIWASYGFRYAMFNPGLAARSRPLVGWESLEEPGGPAVSAVRLARAHQLLPEAYLYGFAHTYRFSRSRDGFLNGEYRSTGWVQYFPYTTAVKTPLALFALLGLSAAFAARAGLGRLAYEGAPLLALFAVYGAFALSSHLNIGHRHIMPVYPALLVAASGAACWLTRPTRWAGAAVGALAAWFAAESIWIRPHYLAYFNELVGPANAWRHVVDGSLDWGQDLPEVGRWLARNPQEGPVFISYFGSGDLAYYGIHATRVGDSGSDFRERRAPARLAGGLWIISVSQFQQAYTRARGPWDLEKEARYRQLLAHVLELARTGRALTHDEGVTLEDFQFARLCRFLRGRSPLAQLNYTLLVFRVTDAEVSHALYEPLDPP